MSTGYTNEQRARWDQKLNSVGPEHVRMHLRTWAGGIEIPGDTEEVPKNHALEWLARQDEETNRQRIAREARMVSATESAARTTKSASRAAWAAVFAAGFAALATFLQAYLAWKTQR